MAKPLLILREGRYYNDMSYPIAVGASQAALIRWVKLNRPGHRRKRREETRHELFFENDETQTYLICNCDMPCVMAE